MSLRWAPAPERLQVFGPTSTPHRRRRVTDAVTAAAITVVLVGASLLASPQSAVGRALTDLAATSPGFLDGLWQLIAALFVLWVTVVVVGALVRRRPGILIDVAAAAAAAWVLWLVIDTLVGPLPDGTDIPVGIAMGAAVAGGARSRLSVPFRRLGRYLVLATALGWVLLGRTTPLGAVIALLLGVLAGAVVRLVLGTDEGRPDGEVLARGLAQLGLSVGPVAVAEPEGGGLYLARTTDVDDGRRLLVRVYGRDARDSQFVAKLWRALWYRGAETVLPTRRLQAEHDAFVSLLAASRGVRVAPVVAVGSTSRADAVVVLEERSRPLVAPSDDQLAQMWQQLDLLHCAGLAMRDLGPDHFGLLDGGDVEVSDLSRAAAARADDAQVDRAQLMVATADLVGPTRAVAVALAHLGADDLGGLVPYLQSAAIGPGLRRSMRRSPATLDLDDLRDRCAETAGIDAPDIAQLRRVSAGTLVRAALISLAAYSIISLLGNVDLSQVADELQGGDWAWGVLALAVGQLPFLSEAVSTQGASPRRLPAGPLTALQVAISFVNLAIPSTAARVATIVRFFQKQGIPAAAAVSISAIESFSGFLVQITILLLTLVFGVGGVTLDLDLDFTPSSQNLEWVVAVVVGLVVAVVAVAVFVPGLRRRVVDRVKPWIDEARDVLPSLGSPVRLAQLFGGVAATQLLYALTLLLCLQVFGTTLDLGSALVVWVIAALFGGLMPVPGGIGVMEAALMTGLVAVGVPNSEALAAAITFRVITFYLPPIWGVVSFRWLERHEYL